MTQTPDNTVDKKRIAKNSIFLYIRMLIVLSISFFAVRLVLEQLGVKDYGLYSLLLGFVTLFCIASQGLGTMLKRFFCYESGLGNIEKLPQIFTIGLVLTLIYSLVFLLVCETLGLWLLQNKLNIPAHSMGTAKIVFHLLLLNMVAQIFTIPFSSLIIVCEKMSFFAKISLVEAILKLISVLILILGKGMVIHYALYVSVSLLLVLVCYIFYCSKNISFCRIVAINARETWKKMASFMSWNILESSGNLGRFHGTALILNVFCDIAYNATWNVTSQICNVITQLYGNILSAATPQILKSYTAENKDAFYELICTTARYAFILLWLVCFPLLLKTELLLKIWLGNTMPPEIVVFTRYGIIFVLIDALFCSLWIAAQANGKVRRFQIEFFLFCIGTLGFLWGIMYFGGSPAMLAMGFALSNTVNLVIRLLYVIRVYHFTLRQYWKEVIYPTFLLTITTCLIGFGFDHILTDKYLNILISLLSAGLLNPAIIFLCALSAKERAWVIEKSKQFLKRS